MKIFLLFLILAPEILKAKIEFPNICDVVATPQFRHILGLKYRNKWCGHPVPRPCVEISYRYPRYFVEVTGGAKETFFDTLPMVKLQLAFTGFNGPTNTYDDTGAYSFDAHVIRVPFSSLIFGGLPCGGPIPDLFCFSIASEHLGSKWKTGYPDLWQPKFQAWSVNPKACLIKGAATSIGGVFEGGLGRDSSSCSIVANWLPRYPPSNQPVCTGWGIHFPRSGTVTSSDSTTASLVIASRIKSIGAEAFQSIHMSRDESWQMIYPHASNSFKEGQNIGFLRTNGVNEIGRIQGKLKNFLYVIWHKVRCTAEVPQVLQTKIWLEGVNQACTAIK